MEGYIQVPRQIYAIVRGNTNALLVWLEVISRAAWKDQKHGKAPLKRGQCVIGQTELASTLGLTRGQIRWCFQWLNRNHITTTARPQSNHKATIVSLVNTDLYFNSGSESNHNHLTSTHRSNHKRNITKLNKAINVSKPAQVAHSVVNSVLVKPTTEDTGVPSVRLETEQVVQLEKLIQGHLNRVGITKKNIANIEEQLSQLVQWKCSPEEVVRMVTDAISESSEKRWGGIYIHRDQTPKRREDPLLARINAEVM